MWNLLKRLDEHVWDVCSNWFQLEALVLSCHVHFPLALGCLSWLSRMRQMDQPCMDYRWFFRTGVEELRRSRERASLCFMNRRYTLLFCKFFTATVETFATFCIFYKTVDYRASGGLSDCSFTPLSFKQRYEEVGIRIRESQKPTLLN